MAVVQLERNFAFFSFYWSPNIPVVSTLAPNEVLPTEPSYLLNVDAK